MQQNKITIYALGHRQENPDVWVFTLTGVEGDNLLMKQIEAYPESRLWQHPNFNSEIGYPTDQRDFYSSVMKEFNNRSGTLPDTATGIEVFQLLQNCLMAVHLAGTGANQIVAYLDSYDWAGGKYNSRLSFYTEGAPGEPEELFKIVDSGASHWVPGVSSAMDACLRFSSLELRATCDGVQLIDKVKSVYEQCLADTINTPHRREVASIKSTAGSPRGYDQRKVVLGIHGTDVFLQLFRDGEVKNIPITTVYPTVRISDIEDAICEVGTGEVARALVNTLWSYGGGISSDNVWRHLTRYSVMQRVEVLNGFYTQLVMNK